MKPENNTGLVEYGIEDETTDYRAHVCPLVRRVYVFETKSGIEAIKESGLESVAVYSACAKHWGHKPDCPICSGKGKVLTALGFPVPVTAIPGVGEVSLPEAWWTRNEPCPMFGKFSHLAWSGLGGGRSHSDEQNGRVRCRDRLGRMLKYYYREAV